jgi:hypothetical protein
MLIRGVGRIAIALLRGRSPATQSVIVIVVLGAGTGSLGTVLGGLGLSMIFTAPFPRRRR